MCVRSCLVPDEKNCAEHWHPLSCWNCLAINRNHIDFRVIITGASSSVCRAKITSIRIIIVWRLSTVLRPWRRTEGGSERRPREGRGRGEDSLVILEFLAIIPAGDTKECG